MPQIGPLEIAIVLLVALLVFGPNRLPQMAKQVGSALRELRRLQQHLTEDLRTMVNDESDAQAPPPSLPPLAASDPAPAPTAGAPEVGEAADGTAPDSSGTPDTPGA